MKPIEDILNWVITNHGEQHLVQAKALYEQNFSRIFPDEPYYESAMKHFNDYVIFQYPLSQDPEDTFFKRYNSNTSNESQRIDTYMHSVFLVQKLYPESIQVLDLREGTRIKVEAWENQTFHKNLAKNIFQGYIYKIGERYYLSEGLIFHPISVNALIRRFIKKTKKNNIFEHFEPLSQLFRGYLSFQRRQETQASKLYEHSMSSDKT